MEINKSYKTVLITGASGNLGRSVIQSLHEAGHTLLATVHKQVIEDQLCSKVADTREVDLTNETAAAAYVESITTSYPELNAAVLLAGGFGGKSIAEVSDADLEKFIALNFKTALHIVRPMLAHFEKIGGGQFVLIGARPALDAKAGKDFAAYAISKAMVIQLSELINAWGKGKHIHSTVIVPSVIDTPENRKSMPKADPQKWVTPEALAEIIRFVVSDGGSQLRETVIKVYNES
jgi:NAD(P)-dependent dehydrogenase (short-subunit alcohol dehydrogenase family)